MLMKFIIFLLLASSLCTEREKTFIAKDNYWPEASYHGYVQVGDDKNDDTFYWLFPSRSKEENDPIVLWLNGGPGCSSELGVLIENGPFFVQDKTLITNKDSWNSKANLLYIDNPLGTGLSFVDKDSEIPTSENQMAKEFYTFLVKFFTLFPSYKGRSFYITGESYAGKYIPNIANYIVNNPNPIINLKGIMIGNGMVNPIQQYPAYFTYALHHNLLNQTSLNKIKPGFDLCKKLQEEPKVTLASVIYCENLTNIIL